MTGPASETQQKPLRSKVYSFTFKASKQSRPLLEAAQEMDEPTDNRRVKKLPQELGSYLQNCIQSQHLEAAPSELRPILRREGERRALKGLSSLRRENTTMCARCPECQLYCNLAAETSSKGVRCVSSSIATNATKTVTSEIPGFSPSGDTVLL